CPPSYLPPSMTCPSFFFLRPRPPTSILFPYTTLFRSSFNNSSLFFAIALSSAAKPFSPSSLMPTCFSTMFAICASNSFAFSISRSEEHTSELQSRENLVCRLLLEKKNVVWLHSDVGHL